jgi:hypothetical protein
MTGRFSRIAMLLGLMPVLGAGAVACQHGAAVVRPAATPNAAVTRAAVVPPAAEPKATVAPPTGEPAIAVMVQGTDLATVIDAVRAVGGEITHELGIINAVGAQLTQTQIDRLETGPEKLRIHADRIAEVSGQRRQEEQR